MPEGDGASDKVPAPPVRLCSTEAVEAVEAVAATLVVAVRVTLPDAVAHTETLTLREKVALGVPHSLPDKVLLNDTDEEREAASDVDVSGEAVVQPVPLGLGEGDAPAVEEALNVAAPTEGVTLAEILFAGEPDAHLEGVADALAQIVDERDDETLRVTANGDGDGLDVKTKECDEQGVHVADAVSRMEPLEDSDAQPEGEAVSANEALAKLADANKELEPMALRVIDEQGDSLPDMVEEMVADTLPEAEWLALEHPEVDGDRDGVILAVSVGLPLGDDDPHPDADEVVTRLMDDCSDIEQLLDPGTDRVTKPPERLTLCEALADVDAL